MIEIIRGSDLLEGVGGGATTDDRNDIYCSSWRRHCKTTGDIIFLPLE
jgi:hypothetical protein